LSVQFSSAELGRSVGLRARPKRLALQRTSDRRCIDLYPVYTIEQTASKRLADIEKTSSRPDGPRPLAQM